MSSVLNKVKADDVRCDPRCLVLGAIVATLVLLFAGIWSAPSWASSNSLVERQRFGFVAVSGDWREDLNLSSLNAGWYVDLAQPACGESPEGMDRALVLRVTGDFSLEPEILGPLVDNHPGTTWLIGNEPDCIWQDNVLPEQYADAYHALYTFIKDRDPASQIAAGGIVQATPLRLEYLDLVLAAYEAEHGAPMPLDVWHIHNAILNEVSCDYDPGDCWGAGIPPGIDAWEGVRRAIDDNDNMTFFADQIWAFRQWMADRGYGGYPLIVTEYGILMPQEYGYGVARVNAFMSATFDFFLSATDAALGNPADGQRLVQRWAWFSLDVPPYDPVTGAGFNGNLFNPDTGEITAFGLNYASHTSSFPPLSYVDLKPGRWQIPPVSVLSSPTETITRPLQVEIANEGTLDSGAFAVVLEYRGPVSGTLARTVENVSPASSHWVSFSLSGLLWGSYRVSVATDTANQVSESTECNNQAAKTIIAPIDAHYLPLSAQRGMLATQGGTLATCERGAVETASPGESSPAMWLSAVDPRFLEVQLPTPNSYPAQLVVDASDRIWVSERDGNKLARFDPLAGTWEEFAIPTANSQPWGVALDASGGVWFAESAGNQIARFEPTTETFVEFPITSTLDSQPWGVAVGPDGAIWFTEVEGNKIGKLTPSSGIITEISLPTANAGPTGIASRGTYVWFVESAANKLSRIADGSINELAIPTTDSAPQDIALTGVGFPWFTQSQGNKIALWQPTTLGMWHEYPVPTANSEPYGITIQGDEAVWFTERTANKLGRWTGTFSEIDLPTSGSLPTDLAVDGAGCIWYTAPGANRIGQLCPPFFRTYLPLIVKH